MFFCYTLHIYHVSTKNQCGRSSGVERNLAKVEVEGSNPFARSKKLNNLCDNLAETIARHDQARHDQRLIDIRDELGAISHHILTLG